MYSNEDFRIHYKNKPYRYIGVAKHSETMEEVVVYECLYPNDTAKLWVRPRAMFESRVDESAESPLRFRPAPRAEVFPLSQTHYDTVAEPLELLNMADDEYKNYVEISIKNYAESIIRSGIMSKEAAIEKSKREFQILLPQGPSTPNHFVYKIVNKKTLQTVGGIWFHLKPDEPTVFIYDFVISENVRAKGLGRAALRLVEQKAQSLGAKKLALHVFGYNTPAIRLYENFGFEATSIQMAKEI